MRTKEQILEDFLEDKINQLKKILNEKRGSKGVVGNVEVSRINNFRCCENNRK
jgi:hypothetical protein